MNDLAPFKVHDDQHVEQTKGRRGDDEEVDCSDAARVVLEKSLPSLGGLTRGLRTILPDGGGRSYQSQFS